MVRGLARSPVSSAGSNAVTREAMLEHENRRLRARLAAAATMRPKPSSSLQHSSKSMQHSGKSLAQQASDMRVQGEVQVQNVQAAIDELEAWIPGFGKLCLTRASMVVGWRHWRTHPRRGSPPPAESWHTCSPHAVPAPAAPATSPSVSI